MFILNNFNYYIPVIFYKNIQLIKKIIIVQIDISFKFSKKHIKVGVKN